jgi:hypothetical protein
VHLQLAARWKLRIQGVMGEIFDGKQILRATRHGEKKSYGKQREGRVGKDGAAEGKAHA